MYRFSFFFLTAAISGTLLFLAPNCLAQTSSSVSPGLAIVNGKTVSNAELGWEIRQLTAEMSLRNRPLTNQQLRRLRKDLINNIIERELLYQHSEQKKIRIRSQWINQALNDLKNQLGGNTALNRYLSQIGMSRSQLKERLRKGLSVRRLLRKDAIRSVKVSEAEMQAFYRQYPEYFVGNEQIRLKHILVAVDNFRDETAVANAKRKIQSLKNRIQNGDDFAIIALEYSNCPSRINGGDLGYLTYEQMIAPFAQAAFELKKGEISDIVKTRLGFHLIKALDRRPPTHLSYKEARPKIERTIRRNKENKAVKRYIATLRSEADIK